MQSFKETEGGKIPPHSIEAEEVVLGQIMIEENAIEEVVNIIKPETFYKESNRRIYESIYDLYLKNNPINIVTVFDDLKKKNFLENVGGVAFVSQLTNKVSSASHIDFHAKIIHQKFIQRELIRIGGEIQTNVYNQENDVADILESAERDILKIADGNIKKEAVKINDLFRKTFKIIEETGGKEDGLNGIPSGFFDLDKITYGWQNSDMIIVAARPSMGKTAFALSLIRNATVDYNKPTAFFSLEMDDIQITSRLLISESGISKDKIKTGRLKVDDWKRLEETTSRLAQAPLYIDDTPALGIVEFRSKARRMKTRYNIQLIVIDYIQLMTASGIKIQNREQEVAYISRQIKAVAKELQIPIIVLAQLNRESSKRASKKPELSDLRESGAIEQDCDLAIFLHRPDYYGLSEEGQKDESELIIAKHRNGAVGTVTLRFTPEYAKFTDLSDIPFKDIPNNHINTVNNNDIKPNESVEDFEKEKSEIPINYSPIPKNVINDLPF